MHIFQAFNLRDATKVHNTHTSSSFLYKKNLLGYHSYISVHPIHISHLDMERTNKRKQKCSSEAEKAECDMSLIALNVPP